MLIQDTLRINKKNEEIRCVYKYAINKKSRKHMADLIYE